MPIAVLLLSVCSTVQAEKTSDAIMEARCAQWADSVDIAEYHRAVAKETLTAEDVAYHQGYAQGITRAYATYSGKRASVISMDSYSLVCAHPKTLDR